MGNELKKLLQEKENIINENNNKIKEFEQINSKNKLEEENSTNELKKLLQEKENIINENNNKIREFEQINNKNKLEEENSTIVINSKLLQWLINRNKIKE